MASGVGQEVDGRSLPDSSDKREAEHLGRSGGDPDQPGRNGERLPRSELTPAARILRVLLPLLLLGGWQLWAISTEGSLLFPSVLGVLGATWDLVVTGEIFPILWLSNQAFLVGTSLALLLAIPIGILLGRSERANQILGVYLEIDLASPTIAFLPIVIVVVGLGLPARSLVVFMFSFALTASLVRSGARTVDRQLIDMAEAFAPTRWQLWRHIIIPGLLPALGGAFRIGISRGVVGMIIVEFVLTSVGLGGLIMDARSRFHAEIVYAGVLIILLEAFAIMAIGRWVERKIAPEGLYGVG